MKRLLQAVLISLAIALAAFIGARIAYGTESVLKGDSGYTKPAIAGTDYSDPTTVTAQVNAWAAAMFSGTTAQYMRANGTIATLPTSMAPSGSAGGSLTGTYPNPTLSLTGVSASTYSGVTVTTEGRVTAGTTRSFNNTPARSIVTTAAAANGFQISSTRDSLAIYSVTIVGTTTILGTTNVSGYVVLEVCPTNSSTAGDWVEVSRVTSGQNTSLTVAVGSLTQTTGGTVAGGVPAGYYARIRSVNTNATPSYTYNSGNEVIL